MTVDSLLGLGLGEEVDAVSAGSGPGERASDGREERSSSREGFWWDCAVWKGGEWRGDDSVVVVDEEDMAWSLEHASDNSKKSLVV